MEYVLGIGTRLVEKYKKNPNIQIFINGILEDEFELANHETITAKTEVTEKWNRGLQFSITNTETRIREISIPKTLKFYTLDSNNIKEGKLEIKIENDDTNYTNGFMTKSTLIQMYPVFLLPKPLLNADLLQRIWKDILLLVDFKPGFNPTAIMPSVENPMLEWPIPSAIKWQNKNIINFEPFGGSGTITYDIVKKHGIYSLVYPGLKPVGLPVFSTNSLAFLTTIANKLQ